MGSSAYSISIFLPPPLDRRAWEGIGRVEEAPERTSNGTPRALANFGLYPGGLELILNLISTIQHLKSWLFDKTLKLIIYYIFFKHQLDAFFFFSFDLRMMFIVLWCNIAKTGGGDMKSIF